MELLMVSGSRGPAAIVVLARRPRGPVNGHAILGEVNLVGQAPQWGFFRRNSTFVEFFTRYMRGELPQRPAILAEAKVKPGEHVYVVDPRVPDARGEVPFHDVVGWYRSGADGRPIGSSFTYNEEHLLVDARGRAGLASDEGLLEAALFYSTPAEGRAARDVRPA